MEHRIDKKATKNLVVRPIGAEGAFKGAMSQAVWTAYSRSRADLADLRKREVRIGELARSVPASNIAKVLGLADGKELANFDIFAAACISHDNFVAIAKALADVIIANGFDYRKTGAFIHYFMGNTINESTIRLPEQTIPALAQEFSGEFEQLASFLEGKGIGRADSEYMVSRAYEKWLYQDADLRASVEKSIKPAKRGGE